VINKKPVVLTFGSGWADLFESSLSRQMAGIVHLPLGNPRFKLPKDLYLALRGVQDKPESEHNLDFLKRLNTPSQQASEILIRLTWYGEHSDFIFLDSALLDTAIGHQILVTADMQEKPVFAVAVDNKSSPLAAAYLVATLYPVTPDDLVKTVLNHFDPEEHPVVAMTSFPANER
jgi:hypothetical protein